MRKWLMGLAIFAAFAAALPHTAEAASLSKAPNNLGLVGYWSFDEGTSTVITDLSGNDLNGTRVGTTWTAGKRSYALNFDATLDAVELPNSAKLNITGSITMTAWIRTTSAGARHIVGGYQNANPWAGYGFGIGMCGEGCIDGKLKYWSNNGANWVSSNTRVDDGQWHHVAVVATSSGAMFYLDGRPDGWKAAVVPGSYSGNRAIGARAVDYNDSFSGQMDEVRIYSRALTSADIAALYRSGSAKFKQPSNLGLVGYWKLDDARGATSTDSSGNGFSGKLTNFALSGATSNWVAGKRGGGLDFDGSNDYVEVSDNNRLDQTTSYSVSAWVYARSLTRTNTTQWGSIVTKGATGEGSGNDHNYLLGYNASSGFGTVDRWLFTLENSAGTNCNLVGNAPADLNSWYHVVAVFDDAANMTYIYVNGAKQNEASCTLTPNANSQPVRIGRDENTAGLPWNGKIDDVRVYSRALSPLEIAAMYRSGQIALNASQNDRLTNGLVGLWSFNGPDISGTTAYDRSGQGNNGTLTNGPKRTIGKVGQAVNLARASAQEVTINDSAPLSPTSAFSVSFWMRRTDNIGSNHEDLAVKSWTGDRGWGLLSNAGGGVTFYVADAGGDSGANYVYTTSGSLIARDEWVHVTAVYDGSGSTSAARAKIYVNGSDKPVTVFGTIPATTLDSGAQLTFGKNIYGSTGFEGDVDELRFYNRALTPTEVKQLYLMGR